MFKIVRHYLNRNTKKTIRTGLTLQEALDWESSFEANSNTCKSKSRKATTKKYGPWYDRCESETPSPLDDTSEQLISIFEAADESIDVDVNDLDLPIVVGTLIDIPVAFNPLDPWEDEITREVAIPEGLLDVCKGNGSYLIGNSLENGEPIVIGYEEV